MPTFKNGDIVKLKSGGPKMTVNGEEVNGYVECMWFTKADERRSESFDVGALIPAADSGPHFHVAGVPKD
jgi:uncharacterized protein YodC (DUF2158 family)